VATPTPLLHYNKSLQRTRYSALVPRFLPPAPEFGRYAAARGSMKVDKISWVNSL
jgi:hypothetical protein